MDDTMHRHALCVRIKLARTSAGLTQAQLARKLSIHPSAVGHWEVPEGSAPTYQHLYAIASMTGCGIEWLATGRGVRNPHAADTRAEVAELDPVERKALDLLRRMAVRKRTALLHFIERFCA